MVTDQTLPPSLVPRAVRPKQRGAEGRPARSESGVVSWLGSLLQRCREARPSTHGLPWGGGTGPDASAVSQLPSELPTHPPSARGPATCRPRCTCTATRSTGSSPRGKGSSPSPCPASIALKKQNAKGLCPRVGSRARIPPLPSPLPSWLTPCSSALAAQSPLGELGPWRPVHITPPHRVSS